jgi:hypothetical protein
MQLCNGIIVANCKGKRIEGYDTVFWNFAKDASRLPCVDAFTNYPKIHIVTSAFVGVAFIAQCLKVSYVVLTAMFARNDVSISIALSSAEVPHNSQRKPARFNTS